jgi:dipeptidyl-peptidase-4
MRFPAALLLLASSIAAAQSPDPALVTVNRIYASRDFLGQPFGPTAWLDDSTYTTIVNGDILRTDAATGKTSVLVSASMLTPRGAREPLDIEGYDWSPDHSRLLIFTNSARVWRTNTRGDFWILTPATRKLEQLGGTHAIERPSTMQFAKFSPDGNRVAYVQEHNLYVEQLSDGRITQLTSDGSVTTINGTSDWVYEEELGLQDGFRWSPDGQRIAYWQFDATGVRDFLLINNTDSLYSFVTPIQYPKAGTTNSAVRIGVVSSGGGATTWLPIPGDPRNNYLARLDWTPDSKEVIVQQLNRRQTVNTLWFCDVTAGRTDNLLVERDSAWLDVWTPATGSGITWIDGGKKFVWLSERDGWQHAYVASRDGTVKLITRGDFDVIYIERVDAAGGWLYYYASPTNATQKFLYRSRLDGSGSPERITPAAAVGVHVYDIAPGAHWAIHGSSSWGTPRMYELVRLPSQQVVRTLVTNEQLKKTVAALKQGEHEFFQVDIGDGVKLDAWMMKPPNFDPSKKYPILYQIYGEPAAQTVRDAWGGADWLWHLMLTQQGYIVASVDNRGTPGPRGRAWRRAMLNKMGALRVKEQSAAARAIAKSRPYIDSTRVAVWGWSGGGSSTLLLMFRAPEVYKVGMAVAPVADVHDYDTIYQERYVGLPSTDSAAYYDASAINFVSGLKGDLLVVHGSGDDNVHFQGTEQLINALIAAGKPFQMMEYPNRTHGIYEGRGTRVHLFNLLTRYLEEHLPPGAK